MLRKHSISIKGHRTSFSLEDKFWDQLKKIASRQDVSVPALVATIDAARSPETNLSSAIRLHVLDHLTRTDVTD